ncbi:MAG: hypothetical protein ACQEW6_12415 [Bacillota bacterium]
MPPLSKDGTGAFQLHSSEYRSPEEVPGGEVLIVGGGNSASLFSKNIPSLTRLDHRQ